MPGLQRCTECVYTGPPHSFPLKKSGNSHTKTCPRCYERNYAKNAKASQRRKERVSEFSTVTSLSEETKHRGTSRISGKQKLVSWAELETELKDLGPSVISLDHLIDISSLGLVGTHRDTSDTLWKLIGDACGWKFKLEIHFLCSKATS
jgi:hypothetical protein